MLNDYLTLVGLIMVTLFALVCFSVVVSLIQANNEAKTENDSFGEREEKNTKTKIRIVIILIAGVAFIVSVSAGYKAYQHLIFNAPEILKGFGIWYLVGYISRVPLLFREGFIFHPYYATEWDEVFKTFFNAFLGPFQIIFTILGIYKHKPL